MFSARLKTLCLVGGLFALISCIPQTPLAPISSTITAIDRNSSTTTAIPSSTLQVFDPTGTATFTAIPSGVVACSTGIPSTSQTPASPDFLDVKDVPMRLIPAGDFIMGSDFDYLEKPVHRVYLDSYYIDKYEVTNVRYEACVKFGACEMPKHLTSLGRLSYFGNVTYEDYPVIFVDWQMAKTYCEWRGARLPTEAEWEKAARGTDGRSYPWGTCALDHTYTDYIYEYGDVYDTKRVGSYEKGKSIYGVYDMIGNVSEWVNDWFSETYYQNSALTNPPGPDSGIWRVIRVYSSKRNEIRVTSRIGYLPTDSVTYVGFRCARPLP